MLNHLRTLLRNRDGSGWAGIYPGTEFSSSLHRAVPLTPGLQTIHACLFGSDPDETYLNYRLQQYLTLLHASPLAEFVAAQDSRVTYINQRADFLPNTFYRPSILGADSSVVNVFGAALAPDPTGQMRHIFRISSADGINAVIDRLTAPTSSLTAITTRMELAGSGYAARLMTTVSGLWEVTIYNRPQWDLGSLVANLRLLDQNIFDELFGAEDIEPYRTWRNLWERARELPLCLVAVLLALGYHIDAQRTNLG